MTALAAQCRQCGTINELTGLGVPDFEQVSCSHCRAPLGSWGTLKIGSDTGTDQASVEPPSLLAAG